MKRATQNLVLTSLALAKARAGDVRVFSLLIEYEGALDRAGALPYGVELQLALLAVEECELKLREICGG